MKVAVEKRDENTAQINLEIPAEHVQQEYSKACKRLGQRVNIPGFRRGKAPRAVVEKAVGQERIKQEALDRILPHAFADAISENQLDVVAPPQVEDYKFDLKEGVQVKALVELRPEVKLPDLSKIEVKVPKFVTPADSEEKELQAIVERMTTLEPVINRPAEANDIVNIDFTGSLNGELIRGGAAKNYRLDLSNNTFVEGFASQIVGHSIAEEFTIKVTFPKDYHDNTLAGKDVDFHVKLNDIKKKSVPELDDDLAKRIGPYETLQALKDEVKSLLTQNEEQENEYRKQKALIDEIVGKVDINIPDSMVNREAKLLMEQVKQRFKGQGLSWEQFLDAQGHEKIWGNLRGEATQRIKTSLTFGAIAKAEGVNVTEEEFSTQVKEMAEMTNTDEKNIMRHLAKHFEAAQAMNDQILSQKIVEILAQRATFVFVDEDSVKSETADEAPKAAAALAGEEFEVISED